jgi:hypothetical protein
VQFFQRTSFYQDDPSGKRKLQLKTNIKSTILTITFSTNIFGKPRTLFAVSSSSVMLVEIDIIPDVRVAESSQLRD